MCDFEDDECWFRHGETSKQTSGGSPFKCSFCEKTFDTHADLIVHRKETHAPVKVNKCRDFQQRSCRFAAEECWYKHDEEGNERAKKSFFQNAQDSNHPPDLMERVLGMMEKLMEKVNILEGNRENVQ